jgi:hypothetical protein
MKDSKVLLKKPSQTLKANKLQMVKILLLKKLKRKLLSIPNTKQSQEDSGLQNLLFNSKNKKQEKKPN